MKWKYKWLMLDDPQASRTSDRKSRKEFDSWAEDQTTVFNDLGSQGWELVIGSPIVRADIHRSYAESKRWLVCFKKPVEE